MRSLTSRASLFVLVASLFTIPSASAAPLFSRTPRVAVPTTLANRVDGRQREIVSLDAAAIRDLRAAGEGMVEIPVEGGTKVYALERFDVFGPGSRIVSTDDAGERPVPFDGTVFRGRVPGDPEAWAILTLTPQGAMGVLADAGGQWEIAPAEPLRAGRLPLHAVQRSSDAPRSFACGVEALSENVDRQLDGRGRVGTPLAAQLSPNTVKYDLAVDCDYEFTANRFGGNLTTATTYATTVLATVALIYIRDINVQLNVTFLNLWTTSSDPYTVGSANSAALNEMASWWNANRASVPRAIAHLMSGRPLGGGIAYLDVLCSGSGYGLSAVDATYSYPTNTSTWDIVVVAHEIGHNFGSWHTHSCNWAAFGYIGAGAIIDSCVTTEGGCNTAPRRVPIDKGTIMSYCHLVAGVSGGIRLDFHPICKTRMRQVAEVGGCLNVPTFQPPRSVAYTPAPWGGTVSWTASGAPGVIGYNVYRSPIQLDLNPVRIGFTTGTSFPDSSTGTFYYKLRSVTASDSSGWSGEAKSVPCAPSAVTNYPTGASPLHAITGDFDENGIVDVATASYTLGTLSVFRGQGSAGVGNGFFFGAITSSAPAGTNPTCLVSGDWNADGIPDIALGDNTNNLVVPMIGQGVGGFGNGSFVAGTSAAAGDMWGMATADFNEDGIADIATANAIGSVAILLGQGTSGAGNGTFATGVFYSSGGGTRAVTVADFNEDGIWDIAAATASGARLLFGNGASGKGDGTFTVGPVLACQTLPFSIFASDFNEDGITDLAVGNSGSSSVSILLGQGAGGVGDGTFGAATHYPAAASPYGVAPIDWNGDGRFDIVVANSVALGTFTVISGNGSGPVGDGTFGAPQSFGAANEPRAVVVGDFNEDGGGDVAVANRVGNTLSTVRSICFGALANALTLTSPNGGEQWLGNENRTITWTKSDAVLAVDVQASWDGGTSWETIAAHQTGTSFVWTVTSPYSTTARVRVVDALYAQRFDASDLNFTIIPVELLDVGAAGQRLSLSGAWPNPSRGDLTVGFTLPDARPASLELIDLAGRRIAGRDVGALGAGAHRVRLAEGLALRPGVYHVRLARGGERVSLKVAVVE